MKKYIAGFIGAGNMGGIFAKTIASCFKNETVAVACSTEETTKTASEKYGALPSNKKDIAENSKYIFLGIKPQIANRIISEIKNDLLNNPQAILVSMLAGVSLESLKEMSGFSRIIRIMPNTPCSVGQGMTQVCCTESVSKEELEDFCRVISQTGKIDVIDEKYIDSACAVSGCGPAFAYIFIESLADGAVKSGLPRDKAYEYASQMLIGAASLALETGKNPGELKDAVCSPGGSTIAGVSALEKGGFRSAVIDAVCSSYRRTKELGEK